MKKIDYTHNFKTTTPTVSNKKNKTVRSLDLPSEILIQIFQYLSSEKDRSNIVKVNHKYRHLLLLCAPFRNIMNIAFNRFKGLTSCPTPGLVSHEKLPLFTPRELDRISSLSNGNSYVPSVFIIMNEKSYPKLTFQIIKVVQWKLEDRGHLGFPKPLAELCDLILNGFNDLQKIEINKNLLLRTALFNTRFNGRLISGLHLSHLERTMRQVDLTSKIDALVAVNKSGSNIHHFDENLKSDEDVLIEAFKHRDTLIEFVQRDGLMLKHANFKYRKDKEVVLAAVREEAMALEFADESLQKDREVVLAALNRWGRALKFVDPILKKDKELVLKAVSQHGYALKYADQNLKKDKEVVLMAVSESGSALEYADESLKMNKEFVLKAIKIVRQAYYYVDESLKNDPDILNAYNNH